MWRFYKIAPSALLIMGLIISFIFLIFCNSKVIIFSEKKKSWGFYVLTDTLAPAESLLHCVEQAASDIGLFVNSIKTEFMF